MSRWWLDVLSRGIAIPGLDRAVGNRGEFSTILMFHRVNARAFETLLDHLTGGYRIVSLGDLLAQERFDPRVVALTFDDGTKNFLGCAWPALSRQGVPATVFLPTGLVGTGRAGWWDLVDLLWSGDRQVTATSDFTARYGRSRRAMYRSFFRMMPGELDEAMERLVGLVGPGQADCRFMDWEDVRTTSRLVDCQPHSVHHIRLDGLDVPQMRREIQDSKQAIQERLGTRPWVFCYPYGGETPQVRGEVQRAGFSWACTTQAGPARRNSDPWRLCRVGVDGQDTPAILDVKVKTWLPRLHSRAMQRRAW